MSKPTDKQVQLLDRFGIKNPPPTRVSCSRLINFILHGNGSGHQDISSRVAVYFKKTEEWAGKRVVSTVRLEDTQTGQVRYLLARSSGKRAEAQLAINEHRFMGEGDLERASAFDACVAWDDGKVSVCTLYYLIRIEDLIDKEIAGLIDSGVDPSLLKAVLV